ncbi:MULTISPECIES: DHHW family protein [unclassified Exiguobacterium]|uniref:DHHW family protein n=1 Tax=unclassified Exiguobacterium TaxID=2644629 RepID=UPI001BEA822A|nr:MULTISPECIES: DHHW family protein [unclassified Exiguobacterium]
MAHAPLRPDKDQRPRKKYSFERLMMAATAVSFMVILTMVGLGTVLKQDRVMSQLENRSLAKLTPPTTATVVSGAYMGELEKYFTDQLLLRGTLVETQARLSKNVLRQPFRNGIYTAPNDYMIESSQAQVTPIPDGFKKFVQAVDRPVYMALAPSKTVVAEKNGILPDYVASNATVRYKKMVEGFDQAGMTNISLDQLKLSDYFKTDHHWNIDGAYFAYQQIVRQLQADKVSIKEVPVASNARKVSGHEYYGSLARKTTLAYATTGDTLAYYDGSQFDGIDVCYDNTCQQPVIDESYIKEAGDYADRYEVFLRGNHGIMSMRSDVKGPKLLVLKDSFANPVLPFLARSANLEVVDIRYVNATFDVSEFAKQQQVDGVLFLHNSNITGLMKTYQQKL